jgi:OOP family OmpA-OmpF porin
LIKNIVIGFAGLAISGAAMAQTRPAATPEQRIYVGASLGQSKIKLDSADFSAAGFGAATTSTDDTDSAYKLYAGYNFNRVWAIEGGYADLGEATFSMAAPGASGQAKVENHSWFVAGKGTWAVTNQIGVFGKLGLTRNKSELSLTVSPAAAFGGAATGSNTRTNVLWGVGAEYAFNRNVGLRVEYEDFGKFGDQNNTGRSKTNLWSIGVTYAF